MNLLGSAQITGASRASGLMGAFLNKGLEEIHAVLYASISLQSNVANVALLIVSTGYLAVYE